MNDEQTPVPPVIRALSRKARRRLVDRLVHEPDAESPVDGSSLIGLLSDEPELVAEVCRGAMAARERDPLRAYGEQDVDDPARYDPAKY